MLLGRSFLETVLGFVSPWLALGLATRLTALVAALALLCTGFMSEDPLQNIDRLYGFFLLGLIARRGPGPLSADAVVRRQLARWFPPLASWSDAALADVPHVVGAGFGGLKAARGLRLAACRVTIIDQRRHPVDHRWS